MFYARTPRLEYGGVTVIVTREMLDSDGFAPLFLHCRNSRAAKEEMLRLLGEEPGDRYAYSEQDICEQMRKIIRKYE